ncbi:MAG: MBL fold metallo-hydrolase [Planctomycetota bacterium]|nr:MBL fold metallo-hydrolase [Planctomycetaceae bacterium]MDQ3330320.1 MBL fold metallo-hydrolase [Planctomycetota bacterium]
MKLTFLGAAGEVTGSQHLLETAELRLLLDCGLFQGRRSETYAKNRQFACNPPKLDAVFLSHAHIDHCGNLPGLYKAGYRGPIYCTRATDDVASVMLLDSARIQEEDAEYVATRLGPEAPPAAPLYTEADARQVSKLFEPLDENEWHKLSPALSVRLSDSGHILGSAITELDIEDGGERKRVVFSGDVGRRGMPLLRNPSTVERADVLICECTYGDRVHPPLPDLKAELLRILLDAERQGGRVVIPAFSLGRTQQIVYLLNHLYQEGKLPRLPVFVDSPLAMRITDLHREHSDQFDGTARHTLKTDDDLFAFEGLHYVRDRRESQSLNFRKGPFVVIAAGGMCENGRVRHHLKHAVADKRNTVLLIGYQAEHTLGRRLQERRETVKIFDRILPLQCRVEKLDGLSAHGDVQDLQWWIGEMAKTGGVGQCFLVHGEPHVATKFAQLIENDCDEPPVIPQWGEAFEV